MLNNKWELTNWAQNTKHKNTNWHQNLSQKSSKNPIFVVRKWAPQEVVLFLTLEVVPKLTLERLKSGTKTNSPFSGSEFSNFGGWNLAKIALSAEFQGVSSKIRPLKDIFRTLENGHSIRHQSIPPLSACRFEGLGRGEGAPMVWYLCKTRRPLHGRHVWEMLSA